MPVLIQSTLSSEHSYPKREKLGVIIENGGTQFLMKTAWQIPYCTLLMTQSADISRVSKRRTVKMQHRHTHIHMTSYFILR